MAEPSERYIVDLSLLKTEEGREAIKEVLGLQFTPIWFKWLGWVLTLTAIQFANSILENGMTLFISLASYVLLFFYFVAFFLKVHFVGIPFVKTSGQRHVVSVLFSGALAWFSWTVATGYAEALSELQKSAHLAN